MFPSEIKRVGYPVSGKKIQPITHVRPDTEEKPKSTMQQLWEECENEDDYTVPYTRSTHGTY